MATTVTPITDQVPTVADWAAMVAAINAGTEDDLASGFTTDEYYTDRILFDHHAGISSSDTSWTENSRLQVELGKAYLVEVYYTTNDQLPTSGDDYEIRFTADTGVVVRGISWLNETGSDNIEIDFVNIDGASTSAYSLANQNPAEFTVHRALLVAVGDTATGYFSLDQRKATDVASNNLQVLYSKMIAKRIW